MDEEFEVGLDHARAFLDILREENQMYIEGGKTAEKALREFSCDWGQIRSGQAWAASNIHKNDQASRLCSDYGRFGEHLLAIRLHPRERIQWQEQALEATHGLKDVENAGRHLHNIGRAYYAMGHAAKAVEYYKGALEIAQESQNSRLITNRLGNLGNAYADLGELDKAVDYHQQALALALDQRHPRSEMIWLINLGTDYLDQGYARRAIEHFKQKTKAYH